jgi:hypothetical protein
LGAKPNPNILTSPKKGLVTGTLPRKPPHNCGFVLKHKCLTVSSTTVDSKQPAGLRG